MNEERNRFLTSNLEAEDDHVDDAVPLDGTFTLGELRVEIESPVFSLGQKEPPFILSVGVFGGGGYLQMKVSPKDAGDGPAVSEDTTDRK